MIVLEPSSLPADPPAPGRDWALFLDVDGTLLELRNTPGQVYASRDLVRLLLALQGWFDGAVALLSGRTIEDLDRIFHPLRLPCAGVHGAECRNPDGSVHRVAVDRGLLDDAHAMLAAFVRRHPGALVEDKGTAIALHTRLAPAATAEAAGVVAALADASRGRFGLQLGKFVAELKPAGTDKGNALTALLREGAFAGRRPLAIGDDATDARAFEVARQLGGRAIGVGSAATGADHVLPTPAACRRWLWRVIEDRRAG